MKYSKKLFKGILSIITVASLLFLCACGDNDEYITSNTIDSSESVSTDKVTIYTYIDPENEDIHYDNDTMFYYPLLDMAHMYNNYCTLNGEGENAVTVVKFDSRDRMIQQMSTEIMAGGGPDIVVLDNELPISKLINQGAFVDINKFIESDKSENALDMENYNKNLMDTGVYNGKRYMMPMLYKPDIFITNTSLLQEYGIDKSTKLTYQSISDVFEELQNSENNISLLESYQSSKEVLLQYINDNIDKEKLTTAFDTKDFKNTVESLKKLITKDMKGEQTEHSLDDNNCLFSKGVFDTESGIYTPSNYSLSHMRGVSTDTFISDDLDQITLEEYAQEFFSSEEFDPLNGWENNQKLFDNYVYEKERDSFENFVANSVQSTFVDGITDGEDISRGIVTCGFMINANSDKQEKAYKFIKYSLGERMQRFITYDTTYGDSYNLPVNNEALKNSYTDMGYDEEKVNKITDDSSFMERYINHIKNINTFEVRDGYYNDNVIGDLVDDYLEGKISVDNFITNLSSKTKIYLYE
ncbi:MAG: ABC transporter substrate-binding protein [Ruminococcus sp.]